MACKKKYKIEKKVKAHNKKMKREERAKSKLPVPPIPC